MNQIQFKYDASEIYKYRSSVFLLLANKLIFLFLISTNVYADWTKAEGRYFISRNISKGEACDRALMLAKRNAFVKNGFQKFKSDQLDICTEIKDKTDCTFYQSTFDYEGGFRSLIIKKLLTKTL